ncbi:MAG: hypothetical protein BZY79_02040 [SAR202 cluster bacterium Casp-Chloro-G4]|nr:hypothetical protein [Chloroflexota bacterium]MDA1227189.1 hypothetical protein [Chloroflexota bacterium]PKB61758.1 MAG: hypothetical protein BZY79_02040 [SAR202 cluster bacterium Casp-Chloro-G4]
MHTTGVEGFNLKSPLERSFGWSNGWLSHRSIDVVKIETDERITGWGVGHAAALSLPPETRSLMPRSG